MFRDWYDDLDFNTASDIMEDEYTREELRREAKFEKRRQRDLEQDDYPEEE